MLALLIASQLARFEGSELRLVTEANLNTFAPKLQQTRNATVESSLLLRPRFDAGNDISIRARFAIAYEWTDSDTTTDRHEPVVSDLDIEAAWKGLPKLLGIETALGVSTVFPTSEASRARTLYFAPGVLVAIERPFSLFGGEVSPALRASYHRPVYRFSTPGLAEPPPYAPRCFGGGIGCFDQASGVANVRDRFEWRVVLSGDWYGFSPGALFQATHQLPYAVEEQAVRVITFFSLWLAYAPLDWLAFELGYSMERNIIGGSGGYENPLFDRHEDMRLYLSVNLLQPHG
jgi:hypothetical protein